MFRYFIFVSYCLILLFSIYSTARCQSAGRYDVVIDELLPDPSPRVGLPNAEFIELKNVSPVPVNLRNWKITDGSSTSVISGNFILQPDSFVVICSSSAATFFSAYGPTIGVNNFPSLNNDEDIIILISAENKTIHAVNYNTSWFNNAVKSEGGWSLEMIDPLNPCSNDNWTASINTKGGTPGLKNSADAINKDKQLPVLLRTYTIDSLTIMAVFEESLDSSSAAIAKRYSIDNGIGPSISALPVAPLFKEVLLKLPVKLNKSVVYVLMVTDVHDCSGNGIGQFNRAKAGLPIEPDTTDLVINEILFNPRPDGTDYVEFYNRGANVFDASKLFIANRSATGNISQIKKLSERPYLIFPGDYITVTENVQLVMQQYVAKNPGMLLQIGSMPSLPDDKGDVLLLSQQGKIIDELKYDEKWQFALITNKEGVALERIEPDKPATLADNWTSAASTSGYGTPTYQNSQLRSHEQLKAMIELIPKIFSPDNDGVDDLCFINYQMAETGCVATVTIFDANGRMIRKLYNHATLSQKGFLRWDGTDTQQKKLPVGNYILLTEVFNLQGKTKKFRNVITLARKF